MEGRGREREGGRREGREGKVKEREKEGVKDTHPTHNAHSTSTIPQPHSHHMWGWIDVPLFV